MSMFSKRKTKRLEAKLGHDDISVVAVAMIHLQRETVGRSLSPKAEEAHNYFAEAVKFGALVGIGKYLECRAARGADPTLALDVALREVVEHLPAGWDPVRPFKKELGNTWDRHTEVFNELKDSIGEMGTS